MLFRRPGYLCLVILMLTTTLRAADPETTTSVSTFLAKNCTSLKLDGATLDLTGVTCTTAAADATDAEVSQCRTKVIDKAVAALQTELDKVVKAQAESDALLKKFEGDSRTIQRLQSPLFARSKALSNAVAASVRKKWATLAIAKSGTDPLLDRAKKAANDGFADARKTATDDLQEACIANNASIIQAVFPKTPTAGEAALSAKVQAEQAVSDAERDAFAEFTKADGFARSVDCIWSTATENGAEIGKLACKPGLLVSGEQVSEIRISGLPQGAVSVTAITSDQYSVRSKDYLSGSCVDNQDLSCDHIDFPTVDPNPIVIAVHTTRALFPTWGRRRGLYLTDAADALRPLNTKRTKLSLLTGGTAPTINVKVKTEDGKEASAPVFVGFARWKIESGGFLAVSKLTDDEIVTEPNGTQVKVNQIRRADNVAQDSGVFVNFVPQNYQSFGVSLGFATPPSRRMSVYLGPSIRVRTFGDRGLASLATGLTMRSVMRFRDAVRGSSYAADSLALHGVEQYRFHWFIGINLGFRIGAFGPGEDEAKGNQ